ncbi:hypothetical protein PV05_05253 [Exophiala xenobiotica]|uniref:Uncharacterized protein n=1 Tax=Exophiala xenobiotica TaxID=348802 RepID=A0A0D2EPF9_9EURO|nr:uncharacterized protein PV05_05253 [Exophiala xenobiotica]KIW56605.1 hypothetical protein PV05_05253 [Exophiala xenobiotica]
MQPEIFINISNLEDMVSERTRYAIASHAAKLRRQRRGGRNTSSAGQSNHTFVQWRHGQDSVLTNRRHQPVSIAPKRRTTPQPFDVLGQGRKDPFAAFAVFDIPDLVHEIIDHAVHHFWPGLSPGNMPDPENPAVTAYLEAIRQAPLAFYAYMVGTAENYELLGGVSSRIKGFSQLCLSYRIKMIELINQEI